MASKDNRSNRKIDEFFGPTAPGASHVGINVPIDVEALFREFCAKKNRRLAFEFL